GRNRDTTWFSMSDKHWPQIEKVYETSLSPDNFEVDGQQKEKLSQIIERFRKTEKPSCEKVRDFESHV
ncbi:MAG: hypothetical protein VX107_19935, partial [Pseudomonadota bacterium]|nr:hypothetical protein [Pseudomonadota bacterium]